MSSTFLMRGRLPRIGIILTILWYNVVQAACPRGLDNEAICSNHGSCNNQNLCICDPKYMGFDCSQYRCPMDKAWAAPARTLNDAHYQTECSNRGICDRSNGHCQCMDGFEGSACQRLACPQACHGRGECLSLHQLSKHYAVPSEKIYNNVWDADKIYGCKCDKGFHGYDCSLRSCPRGDDPMTGNQLNEKQILMCTGTSGYFYIYFEGRGDKVPYDSTIEQLNNIVSQIPTFPKVGITFYTGTTVCNAEVDNPVTFEFLHEFGLQPPIKVFSALSGVEGLLGGHVFIASSGENLADVESNTGTKEWEFCSNRGLCDLSSGICSCYTLPLPGYRSSNGYGDIGTLGDCGSVNDKNKYIGIIEDCVGEFPCSGHGVCSGSPEYKCDCESGWTSGDCSLRDCPMGLSWFSRPSIGTNLVHDQLAVCSNAGVCNHVTGECNCYGPFTGNACDSLRCPGKDTECSGNGRCLSIRELSEEGLYTDDPSVVFEYGTDPNNPYTFDGDSVFGCKCDPGYEGYDCSQRSCQRGDDPTTTDQVDEIQLLKCIATQGSFHLSFRGKLSHAIPFDVTESNFRQVLIAIFGFEDIEVWFSAGETAPACSASNAAIQNVIQITFTIEHGDIPAFKSDTNQLADSFSSSSFQVATKGEIIDNIQSQKGTKEFAICSNKGLCDYDSGSCRCVAGYGSSDGKGNIGERDDCGYRLP